VDDRNRQAEQAPININGAVEERVESFMFLGVHITTDLSWSKHTKTAVKRAQQNLHDREHDGEHGCITAWYGYCSASDRKALQRVVSMAQYITGDKLPTIQDLYNSRCQRKAHKIVRNTVIQVIDCFLC
jgi:hypothetical protein